MMSGLVLTKVERPSLMLFVGGVTLNAHKLIGIKIINRSKGKKPLFRKRVHFIGPPCPLEVGL